MSRILCINGPNLDRLGTRDPAVYGTSTLADLERQIEQWAARQEQTVEFIQSNDSAEIIDAIHRSDGFDGIVINPGAFTHTSAALADALAGCPVPAVEVHISNVRQRDRWRRRSFVGPVSTLTIAGRGLEGYRDALLHLDRSRQWPVERIRYGPHPDHSYHVRRGEGSGRVAVLIHGGFWMDAWGGDTVDGWAIDLARSGVSSYVVGYRRMGSGGGHPATAADIADALEHITANLAVEDLVLIGHSAGAALAMGAVARVTPTPRLVIGVGGIYDLAIASEQEVGGEAATAFLATGAASPISSPPPDCPVLLVHGGADNVVPVDQSRDYHSYLGEDNATLAIVAGDAHFDALDPRSATWQAVTTHLALS